MTVNSHTDSNPRIWIWDVTKKKYDLIRRELEFELDAIRLNDVPLPGRYDRVILRAREDEGLGVFMTDYQIAAVSGRSDSNEITVELFPPAKPIHSFHGYLTDKDQD
jgi:uncharacterized protein (DUF4213/DUF364 family)